MSDRKFAEGCLAEITRLENKRKPEPDRAGAVGRERDVLERLRARVVHLGLVIPNAVGDKRQSLEELHAEVADAIAEITQLEKSKQGLAETNMSLLDDMEVLQTKLRAITEAKPVWQARRIVHGHAFKWFGIHESEVRPYNADPDYETRALAVVAPKGDTEDVE